MKMSYNDLAVKPTEAQLAALLNTDKGFQTTDYNAYWDIRTGEVRIDNYDIETHGIPLFKDGLAGLSNLSADEVVLQFKKASYRRIQKLCDEAEFKSYHKGISMARQFVRGFFLLDELDLHTRTWLLSSVIRGAPVEEIMALLDLYTEQQLKASMDSIRAWDLALFPQLDPMNTKHIILAIAMLTPLAGRRFNAKQTATMVAFINKVIDYQTQNLIDPEVVDFVLEITQAAQKIEWVVNVDTKFALAEVSPADDIDAALDRARDYWLIKEFTVPAPVRK